MKSLEKLKNVHEGEDIYILAAGASLDYIPSSFFDGKTTVGVNRVGKFLRCDYVVTKDSTGFDSIKQGCIGSPKILLSKYETGDPGRSLNYMDGEDVFVFDHFSKPAQQPQTHLISTDIDKLVVSFSTITTALHAAAYMGAKNIIVCGHDCGTINGKSAIDGYHQDLPPHQGSDQGYIFWLKQIQHHTTEVRDKIKEEYGCSVVSLNPFINFSLEGHTYKL